MRHKLRRCSSVVADHGPVLLNDGCPFQPGAIFEGTQRLDVECLLKSSIAVTQILDSLAHELFRSF